MFSWLVTLDLPKASNHRSSYERLTLYPVPPLIPRLVGLPPPQHEPYNLQHLTRHSHHSLPVAPPTLNPLVEAPHPLIMSHRDPSRLNQRPPQHPRTLPRNPSMDLHRPRLVEGRGETRPGDEPLVVEEPVDAAYLRSNQKRRVDVHADRLRRSRTSSSREARLRISSSASSTCRLRLSICSRWLRSIRLSRTPRSRDLSHSTLRFPKRSEYSHRRPCPFKRAWTRFFTVVLALTREARCLTCARISLKSLGGT